MVLFWDLYQRSKKHNNYYSIQLAEYYSYDRSLANLTEYNWCTECPITARQYGEVVLPDESTEQGPGTLADKLSRCKEGMAHFLQSGYRILWPLRASRYRVVKVLVIYPGAVKLIGVTGVVSRRRP
jgi:hypothetical protein